MQSWGSVVEAVNPLDGGGAPATFDLVFFNTLPVAGAAKLSDLTELYEFAFARATLYRRDLVAGADEVLGIFYLEDPSGESDQLLKVRMSDVTLMLEDRMALTRIVQDLFPEAAAGLADLIIPRQIGIQKGVRLYPIQDGDVSTLAAAIDDDLATTLQLAEGTGKGFTTGTLLIGEELMTYDPADVQADVISNVTRGAFATTADGHALGDEVLEVRTDSYLFAAGEHSSRFRTSALVNVEVNGTAAGAPATIVPDFSLPTTPGRRFIGVRFTPADVKVFHLYPGAPQEVTVARLNSGLVNEGTNSTVTRVIPAPGAGDVATRSTVRVAQLTINSAGGTGPVNFTLKRKVAGGAYVTIVAQNNVQVVGLDVTLVDSRSYASDGDETFQLFVQGLQGDTNAAVGVTFNVYTVEYTTPEGGVESTAGRKIGNVTADVVGILDDSAGAVTGRPAGLISNPAHVLKYVGLELYGLAEADFDPRLAIAAGALSDRKLRWDFPLGGEGLVRFSDFRRKAGDGARASVFTEAGLLTMKVWPDVVEVVDVVLDHLVDVAEAAPAEPKKTATPQVFTQVDVAALKDYAVAGGGFQYSRQLQDLTQPGLDKASATPLELPYVADTGTADALGAYWLRWWKRQRWEVELITWQNALALEKGDHFSIVNHPILGAELVFRIIGKSYLLGDDNPSRIRIRGIEANP